MAAPTGEAGLEAPDPSLPSVAPLDLPLRSLIRHESPTRTSSDSVLRAVCTAKPARGSGRRGQRGGQGGRQGVGQTEAGGRELSMATKV